MVSFYRKLVALLTVTCVPVVQGEEHQEHRSSRETMRALQAESESSSSTTLQAQYKARYQLQKGSLCVASPMIVQVACGGPNMEILNVSDPTINCGSVETDEDKSFITCTNNCTGVACQNVYELVWGLGDATTPLGEVEFQCTGETAAEVQGSLTVQPTYNVECSASTYAQAYHFAQLGVACPNDVSDSPYADYIYDDYHSECRGPKTFTVPLQSGTGLETAYDYACTTGWSCFGTACTFTVEELSVESNVARFQDSCVNPPVATTTESTVTPITESEPDRVFTARFEASWGIGYNGLAESSCTPITPAVRVMCPNSDIQYVNATSTVACTAVSLGIMECVDSNSANTYGRLTGVTYDCTGPALPETKVEFPEATAECNAMEVPSMVRHIVQLGVTCRNFATLPLFLDSFFECAAASHQFDLLDATTMTSFAVDRRFSCYETAFVLQDVPQTLAPVAIHTDTLWTDGIFSECYTISLSTPPPMVTTTTPPSTSVTSRPLAPVYVTMVPMSAPKAASATTPTTPSTAAGPLEAPRSSDNGSLVLGTVIGGSAVVLLLVGLVIYLVVMRLRSNRNAGKPKPVPPQPAASYFDQYDHDQLPPAAPPLDVTSHYSTSATTTVLTSSPAYAFHETLNPVNLTFKDQARTARERPVHVEPVLAVATPVVHDISRRALDP